MTTELEKAIALLMHLDELCFILNEDKDEAYKGYESYDEAFAAYEESKSTDDFDKWCADTLEAVEPYDENDYNRDYNVFTDEEADQAWDEALDNYLEECIYPELQPTMRNYFDEEAWKIDARGDGRGHSLSGYDGNEDEQKVNGTAYYIYRQN